MFGETCVDGEGRCPSLLERCQTDGPWAAYGPKPLVTRPVKLFVNLLLVATRSFLASLRKI